MGKKAELYVEKLKALKNWDNFLMKESGLPGPRGNLEIAQAFAEIAEESLIQKYISINPEEAPENTAKVFLTFCGVVGLGTLINKGKIKYLKQLRAFASDHRWRIREAVAIALQSVGNKDINFLIKEMRDWSKGNPYEKRAAVAALCEPRLLKSEDVTSQVLDILDDVTLSIEKNTDPKSEGSEVLKKGLAYGWSVAIVAFPEKGKKIFEKWVETKNKEIIWIMMENLKKNRLRKMDKEWVLKQIVSKK